MQKAFTPITLRSLTLRNRFIKTATNEGMWTDGLPAQQLTDYHARLALNYEKSTQIVQNN